MGWFSVFSNEHREPSPVNSDGITWAAATDEQKAAGGFVKDQITYDGTTYYMTGRVTSWTEADASGKEIVRHGIAKTYYTDDTYTTVKSDVDFAGFENRFTPDLGNVDFKKVDGAGDPLQGAEFTLYKDEACTVPATDLDTEGNPVWTARSDSNGKVSFENVRVGTYYMKETKAPEDYELDETIYKVIIEDEKDTSKTSKITILGDETETAVNSIANAKSGEITVLKKWLNAAGTEIEGGSNSATVWLKRKHMVAEEGTASGTHTVTVQMTVEDGGVQSGTPVTKTVEGDTIVIEWDDEWQRNFDWNLTIGDKSYKGWIGDEIVTTDNYIFEQVNNNGRSRRLTIPEAKGDVTLTTKYWVNWLHSDGNHWNNLNNPVISAVSGEPNYVTEDDTAFNNEKHTQVLGGSSWSHTWSIGGSEGSYAGFDYPAMDNDGKNYLYYVVELDAQGNAIEVGGSPLEGYVLKGYSANNNIGISNQGTITVFNQSTAPAVIDVIIKKTDNAENSTNYLEGAVFKLMYRSDSSGTYSNVSSESVPELDSESKFTVPKAGITLTGLVDGQYQLQEISPPSGYVITNSTPVIFTVSGGAITSTDGTITGVRYTAASETSDAEFIIPNEPGAALPNTGGPGTRIFIILGTILFAGAGLLLFRRRRTV
ncbi:MAG: LPXTG cell wall anchor domain-containing protein [Blautia sp.]|nr:LPXTG cell wall anchor domain-containing protein [Blautia sp.]